MLTQEGSTSSVVIRIPSGESKVTHVAMLSSNKSSTFFIPLYVMHGVCVPDTEMKFMWLIPMLSGELDN